MDRRRSRDKTQEAAAPGPGMEPNPYDEAAKREQAHADAETKADAEASQATTSQTSSDTFRGVTTSKWRGHTVYRCPFCAYNSVRLEDIQTHAYAQHGPKIRKLNVELFDKDGNPITHAVEGS